jgi:hypothetical protein
MMKILHVRLSVLFHHELAGKGADGFWQLKEASEKVATDSSGNGLTGTYNGTVTPGPEIYPHARSTWTAPHLQVAFAPIARRSGGGLQRPARRATGRVAPVDLSPLRGDTHGLP